MLCIFRYRVFPFITLHVWSQISCHYISDYVPLYADIHFLQQTKDQANLISSLRAELASATNSTSTAPDVPLSTTSVPAHFHLDLESDSRFAEVVTQKSNLERELQLMASAWYDQNTRLISNTVGISISRGRPPPEPKGFLGRQRRLVDGVLIGRS